MQACGRGAKKLELLSRLTGCYHASLATTADMLILASVEVLKCMWLVVLSDVAKKLQASQSVVQFR